MRARRIFIILLLLLIGGCTNQLNDYINERFPPASLDRRREEAISTAVSALSQMKMPNFAFGVSLASIVPHILTDQVKSEGITAVHLKSSDQLLRVVVDFDRVIDSDDDLLKRLKPRVSGSLTMQAGVSSAVSETLDSASVTIHLLPAFEKLEVKKIKIADEYDVSVLGPILVQALQAYADNVSGLLGKLPLTAIHIPTSFADLADPSRIIILSDPGITGEVTLAGKPAPAPIRLHAVAAILADDRVFSLAEFVPIAAAAGTPAPPETKPDQKPEVASAGQKPSADELFDHFKGILNGSFGLASYPNGNWVAVRKDLVSAALNDIVKQTALCTSVDARIGKQDFHNTISFPDEHAVNCTPNRECSSDRDCSVAQSHDTRDCRRCIWTQCPTWSKPFRQCEQCGNDPICEGEKAAQNRVYDADYLARKADCERIKAQEKITCEAEKAGAKALCETGKELLGRLARTGKFANIDGSYQGDGELRTCLREFALSPDLGNIHVTMELQGTADIDIALKFVPLDIVGHLTCQVPWSDSNKFKATIPNQSVAFESGIEFSNKSGEAALTFQTAETELDFRIRPGPSEYLLTNVNMNLACRGMDLLAPLVIPATAFVPELRGDFKQKVRPMTIKTALKLPTIDVLDKTVSLTAAATQSAIVIEGTIK